VLQMLTAIFNSCMGIMINVTQSLLGMIFERTTMLIIEKRIAYELVQENIKELILQLLRQERKNLKSG
jgi:hypothetical protein